MPDEEPAEMLEYETGPSTDIKMSVAESVAEGAGGAAQFAAGSGAAGYLDTGGPAYHPDGYYPAVGSGAEGTTGVAGQVEPSAEDDDG